MWLFPLQVTGLYAESHGILASSMYDPVSHKHFSTGNDSDPMWWSEAEPLWITALDAGYKTATMMWPGSDVVMGNRTATHFAPYNSDVTFKERLRNVTNWMQGNEKVGKSESVSRNLQTDVSVFPFLLCWVSVVKLWCTSCFIPPGARSHVCSSLLGGARPDRPHIWPRQQHCHGHSAKRGAVM